MDKFEALIRNAQYSVCILGNPETSDFELVDLDPAGLPAERREQLSKRGMKFIGVLGVVKCRPRVALTLPLNDEIVSALSAAFVQRIEKLLNGLDKPMGDSVEWLQQLWELPDTRNETN